MSADPLSVALLNPSPDATVQALGVDLLAHGHSPRVITSHWRPPEPWTLRNIEPYLSHLPFTYASLRAQATDVAHAFHWTDALVARRWSQRGGGPSVFSCAVHPSREWVAAIRLRKTIVERAICDSDAVIVTSLGARDAVWRWFGREAEVLAGGSGADAHLAVYRRVLERY